MNIREQFILNVIEDSGQYKAMRSLYSTEVLIALFDMIGNAEKNISLQSAAMQLGLRSGKRGPDAFSKGIQILEDADKAKVCKLKTSEENRTAWLTPLIQFDDMEKHLMRIKKLESHEEVTEIGSTSNLLLGRFGHHDKPQNREFIEKINRVPFVLDMDIVMNFEGENMPLNSKEMLAEYMDKPIYFKWAYDKRGRSYSEGYGINIQGNKTTRAYLEFLNREVIQDPTPLYIALANAAGHDKWSWKKRIAWGKQKRITRDIKIPDNCEYPEAYVKAMRALCDWQDGVPSGYMMELDATASGLQVMAMLMGDPQTAKEVNLGDSGRREDIYQHVADRMNDMLQRQDISKAYTKQPVMTHYYNSIKNPRDTFEDDELEAFYKVLDGLLPAGERVMKILNKQWNPRAKHHTWVLPDGHTAHVKTMTQQLGVYTFRDVKLEYLYYVNKGNKTDFRSLAPNMVHSIDGYIARQMVLRAPFELVHVHDCFLFHPNNWQEVRRLYKELMIEINEEYNINHLVQSLNGKVLDIEVGNVRDLVLQSEYALS